MNKWLTPKGITSIIFMVGALAGAVVMTATYITLPSDVEALQEDFIDLKQILQKQQTINEFYYNKERNQPPPYEPPEVRRCWDYAGDGYEYEYDCNTGNWL